jgi:hypothetical protein
MADKENYSETGSPRLAPTVELNPTATHHKLNHAYRKTTADLSRVYLQGGRACVIIENQAKT